MSKEISHGKPECMNNTRGFEYDIYVQEVLYADFAGAKIGDAATVKKAHFKRYPLVSRVTTGSPALGWLFLSTVS